MKPVLLIAAALALVGAAPAGTPWSDAIPPERFQGPALVPVLFVSPEEVRSFCGQYIAAPPGMVLLACTLPRKDGGSLVVMPHPCPIANVEYYARIACHEIAHTNRWGANHER